SDVVDGERDMDTILRQDREALQKAGLEAPYVLCPHSLSGYEATLWAQKYPDEVEAIVGLDMCTPNCESEEILKKEQDLMKVAVAINKFEKATGLVRLGSLDQSGTLSEEEDKIFTEICCHKLLNKTVMSENDMDILALYDELNSEHLPTVPMLLYLSPDSTQFDDEWEKGMQALADASSDGRLIRLECGHYVHDFEYERISGDMKEFIERLEKS
ncbi:MAG: alpha/beta hydrolase, partial [Ruminococcus sp.]|nr:alpha/beta hydrolase [Ruminococcus sp.]